MAEKSNFIQNVKGERISLPSLSLSQLLKHHQLEDVMITLKRFEKQVQIADKEVAEDLHSLIGEISFLITFHKKLERTIV